MAIGETEITYCSAQPYCIVCIFEVSYWRFNHGLNFSQHFLIQFHLINSPSNLCRWPSSVNLGSSTQMWLLSFVLAGRKFIRLTISKRAFLAVIHVIVRQTFRSILWKCLTKPPPDIFISRWYIIKHYTGLKLHRSGLLFTRLRKQMRLWRKQWLCPLLQTLNR